MTKKKQMRVLLVEDNLHDIEITKRAFSKAPVKVDLVVVRYGQDALDYLNHCARFHPPDISPRPEMILLDLNLPRMNGLEVLRKIKQDAHLRSIPVIILTVSERSQDILPSYDLGANTYIQKPVAFSDFLRVVKGIQEYWMGIASLPTEGN
ncbi:MAG: response regulator [Nitrospiria bacterium]